MNGVDDEEFTDMLESVFAMSDDMKREARESVARGEALPAVALQVANRLQDIIGFMQLKFPSQWKVS